MTISIPVHIMVIPQNVGETEEHMKAVAEAAVKEALRVHWKADLQHNSELPFCLPRFEVKPSTCVDP